MNKRQLKQSQEFVWQNRLILGMISVLQLMTAHWGIQTGHAQRELDDVRRRLRKAYQSRKET